MSDSSASDSVGRHEVRVRYGETDQMGVAHHGSHVAWFEEARTEWMRSRGMSYRELEASGVMLPVVAMKIDYRSTVAYDDVVLVETWVKERGRASITFAYRVIFEQEARIVAEAEITLACVDRDGKLRRLPEGV